MTQTFAAACLAHSPPSAPWIGIEHEFLCHDIASGARVGFGTVIDSLGLPAARLVPTDPLARWLPSGTLLTADTREAELATPPTDLGPGFARRIDAWAAWERLQLFGRVPELRLTGDSTHINVSIPDDVDADDIAELFVTRFAVGQMLLMDRAHSPGLLVRPRPGRLEIGGEYAVGSALRVAIAYAAGATLACIDAARSGAVENLPPAVLVRVERNVLRYGWYVARTAFGDDLYVKGRASWLAPVRGGLISAGTALSQGWSVARRQIESSSAADDLRDADLMTAGRIPLPIERAPADLEHDVATPAGPESPFGAATATRSRPTFEIAPVLLTWQLAVFLVATADHKKSAFAAIPGRQLEGFVSALRSGDLDQPIDEFLRRRHHRTRLLTHAQTRQAGLFDEMGLRVALLAPERDQVGRPMPLTLNRPLPRSFGRQVRAAA